jgi:hypothetical protein
VGQFHWPLAQREAISLAPRLQPGGHVSQDDSLNRFQRFLCIPGTETVRNGFFSAMDWYHRAEAAVLMRSLRVPTNVTVFPLYQPQRLSYNEFQLTQTGIESSARLRLPRPSFPDFNQ